MKHQYIGKLEFDGAKNVTLSLVDGKLVAFCESAGGFGQPQQFVFDLPVPEPEGIHPLPDQELEDGSRNPE